MKKVFSLVACSLVSLSMFAEGYQVNLQSARQAGMGHVGTGMKLGAESMHFNPAGLTSIQNTADFSVAGNMIFSNVKYTNGSYTAKTDNGVSTPMSAYAGFKLGKRWAAGLAVTTPYGSSLNWGDNWRGADLIQKISLQSFCFQPTVAYQVLDNLSIGAGLMVFRGNFEIDKSLLPIGFKPGLPGVDNLFPVDAPAASINLKGDAKTAYGFNVGVLWNIEDNFSFGISYRSKAMIKVNDGDASISFDNEKLQNILQNTPVIKEQINALNGARVKTQLPAPSNLTVGFSYKPTEKWTIAADLQYVGWNAYDSLNFEFNKDGKVVELKSEKNYSSSIAARIGTEYETYDWLTLRAGFYYDQTPVNAMYYNPETPGANKFGVTTGATFNLYKGLSADLALAYVFGTPTEGRVQTGIVNNKPVYFQGKYTPNAFNLSLGLRYNF